MGAPEEAAAWWTGVSTCGASTTTGGGHLQDAPPSSNVGRSVSKAMWRSVADSACQQSTGIIMCPEGARSASTTRDPFGRLRRICSAPPGGKVTFFLYNIWPHLFYRKTGGPA